MTAKHKPATSLPWRTAGEQHDRGSVIDAAMTARLCEALEPQDAAYIVHAANAYPRAIELLQYCADHAGIGNPLKGSIQAFLQELGEDK